MYEQNVLSGHNKVIQAHVQSRATGIEDKGHHVLRAVVGARPDLRIALSAAVRSDWSRAVSNSFDAATRANGRGNGQRRPARFVGRAAPRGSLAGRRVRHTRRPGTLALRVANGGRGPGPTRNGGAAGALRGPVAGRDSGRRGGRSRSRVERSREGRWWSDARTVRSSTRAAAKRGKLITVSEWRAPPTGPRPDRSACPDGSSRTAPPPAHAREARARESRRVGCRALAAAGVVRFKSNRFEPRSRTWRLIVHAIRAHSGTVQGMC